MRGKVKMDVPNYSGCLNLEELIDWVREMENYFGIEQIEDPKRVKFTFLKLKNHTLLWWGNMQSNRVKMVKERIKH